MLYKCINNKSDFWHGNISYIEEWKEYNSFWEFSITIRKNKYNMIKLENWNSYQKDRFVLVDKEF